MNTAASFTPRRLSFRVNRYRNGTHERLQHRSINTATATRLLFHFKRMDVDVHVFERGAGIEKLQPADFDSMNG